MHNGNNEYTFLINGDERLTIVDMSVYSAKKRAKRVAGAGVDCVLIETRKGFKKRND